MAHMIETMAYTGQTPWHGLGSNVGPQLTPQEMLKAAGCDWAVEKRPLYIKHGDGELLVQDKAALTRVTDGRVLDVVGRLFVPTQNEAVFDFFKRFTAAAKMTMETAGSLDGGRYVWALAKIKHDVMVTDDDKIKGHLLLVSPHVFGKALVAQLVATRVVCMNTLNLALREADGPRFSMPHVREFDAQVQADAELALGLAVSGLNTLRDQAKRLGAVRAKPQEVTDFFYSVAGLTQPEAANDDGKTPKIIELFQRSLATGPGSQLDGAKGTWWGALNAVTHTVDHLMGADRGKVVRDAWLGHRGAMKRRALDMALDMAA